MFFELPLHHSKNWKEIWLHLLPHYVHHCPNTLNITFASSLVCFQKAYRECHQSCVVRKNEYQHKTCSWKHHKKKKKQPLKQLCLSLIICGIQSKILHKHSSSTISSIINLQLTPPNESNKALKPQPWSWH